MLMPLAARLGQGLRLYPRVQTRATAMAAATGKPKLRGVVFDMDGTLTVPVIDFKLMRSRVGVPDGQDILDAINSWDEERQKRAHAIIQEIELQALQDMKVMPGAKALCDFLDSKGLPRGLVTRNVLASVDYFHTNHFSHAPPFNPSISRECAFPYKPSPAALLHICESWGISASECVMVGDSVRDDVVCGNRAGAFTILLDLDGRGGYATTNSAMLQGELKPHHIVHSLGDIVDLLDKHYDLQPPPRSS